MEITLQLVENMRLKGINNLGHETYFDTHPPVGGQDLAPTPMEVVLESMAACSCMDIIPILKKKKKTVTDIKVSVNGTRSETHPKVFTKVHFVFELTSPDAELADLNRAVELSQNNYCSVTIMIKRSGCDVTYDCIIHKV